MRDSPNTQLDDPVSFRSGLLRLAVRFGCYAAMMTFNAWVSAARLKVS